MTDWLPPLELFGVHKQELLLDPPLLPAPSFGPLGEAVPRSSVVGWGGVTTPLWPLSEQVIPAALVERPAAALYRPRQPASHINRWLKRLQRRWRALAARQPLIVALQVTGGGNLPAVQEEVRQYLPEAEALWLTPAPGISLSAYLQAVAGARQADWPLLAALPLYAAASWSVAVTEAGADLLVVAAPPVGELPGENDQVHSGGLYAPALLPLTCRMLRQVREAVGPNVPLAAAGGLHSWEDVRLCQDAGATVYIFDTLLWRYPDFAATRPEAPPR